MRKPVIKQAEPKLMDKQSYDKLCNDIENAENDLGLLEEMMDILSWENHWPTAIIATIKNLRRDLKRHQTVAAREFKRLEALLEREDNKRSAAHEKFCERCGHPVSKSSKWSHRVVESDV